MDARLKQLGRLVEIIDRLRAEDGCPWDRKQTLATMISCLCEETAEVADAVADTDLPHVREELGDVLMNVLLMSRIAEQDHSFSLGDVAQEISDKLIRRHPHVFGDREAATAEAALQSWESAKAEEREGTTEEPSRLAGIPAQMSALQRAQKLASRAAKTGFDWPTTSAALVKVEEELQEVRQSLEHDTAAQEVEFGDLLFATACACRLQNIDADQALRKACRRFTRRFQYIERHLGDALETSDLEAMEDLWQQAKAAGL